MVLHDRLSGAKLGWVRQGAALGSHSQEFRRRDVAEAAAHGIPGRPTDSKQPKAQQGDSPLNQFQARLEKPTESQPGRGGLGEPKKRREAESI